MNKHLGKTLTVDIQVDSQVINTPADLAKRQQETQQKAAENAVFSDPVVQQMIQTFDATVIEESIH